MTLLADLETELEAILEQYEQNELYAEALSKYQALEQKILAINTPEQYAEQQAILAACLMRQGNMLRSLGQFDAASQINEREIIAARASGDGITLARSLFSLGVGFYAQRELAKGQAYLAEAYRLFASRSEPDYQQGLGWYWIIRADLINIGLIAEDSLQAIEAANQAIAILEPVENWRGVSRAYEARSLAYKKLEQSELAEADALKSKYYLDLK